MPKTFFCALEIAVYFIVLLDDICFKQVFEKAISPFAINSCFSFLLLYFSDFSDKLALLFWVLATFADEGPQLSFESEHFVHFGLEQFPYDCARRKVEDEDDGIEKDDHEEEMASLDEVDRRLLRVGVNQVVGNEKVGRVDAKR